jgi:hypothetical protein
VKSFGYRGGWIAVRHDDPMLVAEVLGLSKVRLVDADVAVELSHGEGFELGVVGPVDGWCLIPCSLDSVHDGLNDLTAKLSTVFGVVHVFGTYRTVDYVRWETWVGGIATRRYEYENVDGVTIDEGERSPAEVQAGCLTAAELAGLDDDDEEDEVVVPHEDGVFGLAGLWSVNPSIFGSRTDLPATAIVGSEPQDDSGRSSWSC